MFPRRRHGGLSIVESVISVMLLENKFILSMFKDKVYKFTKKIPKGKVATYKKVAMAIGSPKAARGVAMVLSKNFDPKIPCHRVVRTDGSLGGYNRGGIVAKAKLLKSEGVLIENGKVDSKTHLI